MAIAGIRLSAQAQRFAAAGLVVLAVAASVWLFGRPAPPAATIQAVAAAEPWQANREPGAFVTVEVPAAAAALFVTPDELAGRVPTVPVPAGAVLSEAMLAAAGPPADPAAAALTVPVTLSLWPEPGPAAGDTAVVAARPGGCAHAIVAVLGASETQLTVEAGPDLAHRLAGGAWWAWESPPAGWPPCPPPPEPADPDSTVLAVSVDLSLWPEPGPAAGDTAVVAARPGGCADAVVAVLGASETQLTVEAGPDLAHRLAGGAWWAWESPPAGWPPCPPPPEPADPDSTVLAVSVDLSLWPEPGPAAGDTAVVAARPGGCADAIVAVLGASVGRIEVEAGPELAAALGTRVWWAWPSPPGGWPGCGG